MIYIYILQTILDFEIQLIEYLVVLTLFLSFCLLLHLLSYTDIHLSCNKHKKIQSKNVFRRDIVSIAPEQIVDTFLVFASYFSCYIAAMQQFILPGSCVNQSTLIVSCSLLRFYISLLVIVVDFIRELFYIYISSSKLLQLL